MYSKAILPINMNNKDNVNDEKGHVQNMVK